MEQRVVTDRELQKINNIFKNDVSIVVAYLFGSQAAGKANKYSDVDIAILFDTTEKEYSYIDKQIDLILSISDVLDKEVDVVILNRASLTLQYTVIKEGKRIYERADRTSRSFEARAIVEYFDFLPLKTRMENGLIAKIKRMYSTEQCKRDIYIS
jgi:predicted nucleotidyltransferase